ncbi:MAG: tRNA threonylcarbamoyladenosine dehydratase [Lachnospiraceae bacterium]|nr:tRNA threonylcarbamoyladenosine dehydratase [Lachnospiraceae bacterium]
MEAFSRTELLIGKEALNRLSRSRVAIFGIGGVGGYVVEALIRSGVGALDLIDNDTVAVSNLNRQIIATTATVGQYKVDAARERCLSINPLAQLRTYRTFYLPETADQFDFHDYDYVVDAIDTVSGKLMLIEQALHAGTPVISSMGAGNKMNPAAFEVADISETTVCPLARVMRRELRKRGIEHVKVVYSREPAMTPLGDCSNPNTAAGKTVKQPASAGNIDEAEQPLQGKRQIPGSNAFVPAAAGLLIASEVVKDLIT